MSAAHDSLSERVEPISTGAFVAAACFLNGAPVLALGDGRIRFGGGVATRESTPHKGAILVAAHDANRLITGCDAGAVFLTGPTGENLPIADEKGKWIDAVALGPSGATAWSAGRTVTARDGKGQLKTLALTTTSRGLCFAAKGYRLAATHADGATLWFPNAAAEPEKLAWKGVHLDVVWSADGRFVVTSMQENQLHGWQLPAKAHMRMSGYPAKSRSLSWSSDGSWLATSGAEAAIIWPFGGNGPTGKAPRECGVRSKRVSRVAFHPKALVLAIGYEDGCVLLVRLTDASELLVRRPGGSPITAMSWDAVGQRLLFGAEDGEAGLLTLPGS